MAKIIGGTTSTPMRIPDWNQTNPNRSDCIKNKPDVANALKGNAKAAAVVIDDISPIAHEMSVKVSSKNLLDERNGAGDIVFYNASGVAQYKVGYMFPLPTGTYTISGINKNNSSENCNVYIGINDKDDKVRALSAYQFIYNGNIQNLSFSINEGDRLIIYCSKATTDKTDKESVDAFNIQVEVGTVATPYMPYANIKPYSKNLIDESKGMSEVTYYDSTGECTEQGYELTLSAGTYTISGERYSNKDYSYYDEHFWIKAYTNDAQGNYINEIYLFTGTESVEDYGWIRTTTITVGEGEKLFIVNTIDGDLQADFHIQVEKGIEATAYEPYKEISAVVSQYGSSNLLWFKDFTYSTDAREDTMVNGVFTVSSVQDFASTNIISATRFKAQYCGVEVFPAGTYIFSAETISYYGTRTPYLLVKLADGTTEQFMAGEAKTVTQSFTPTSILTEEYGLYDGQSYTTTFKFEVGDTATPYEPFTECIATAAVEADGTVNGLISHYPTTTLLTDTDGAIIECEYNKDLNKAYDALAQAIISLGGNV